MLSIEVSKKILQKNGVSYSDEEVKRIRKLLYKLAELEYQIYKELKSKSNANSNHLHKGFD